MAHAILSSSGASRWLACTPSARLEQGFPDKAGPAAEEGTLAHELGELLIRQKLKRVGKVEVKKRMAEITASKYYNAEMQDHCENYAAYVIEQFNQALSHTNDALLFLETKLDLTDYVPEGFGTGDVVIIADGTMRIIDLKYGKGVPVSAVENKQMMLYTLGGLKEFDYLYQIEKVEMTIYQPRLDSISDYEMQVTDLVEWANSELRPKAEKAFAGDGEFSPGDHCRFCKARAMCRANAEVNLELAKHDFKAPALLTDAEISDILNRAGAFTTWLTGVTGYALNEAIAGKIWPGYKLVEGRSNRKYGDEKAITDALLLQGYNEETYLTKKLLGITGLEKAIGKKEFTDLVGPYLVKPPGSPTLVPESDKRPAMDKLAAAQADFADNDFIDN